MTKKKAINILFELSGEHPELPFAELEAVLNALYRDFDRGKLKFINGFAMVEIRDHSVKLIEKLAVRLAMCRTIYEVIVNWSDLPKK